MWRLAYLFRMQAEVFVSFMIWERIHYKDMLLTLICPYETTNGGLAKLLSVHFIKDLPIQRESIRGVSAHPYHSKTPL